MLSSVVTSILSIRSIFLHYFPMISINIFYFFRALQILGKWGSILDKKRTSFFTLRAPVSTDLWFFIVFSHCNTYYPDPNKTVGTFLLFSNIFFNNLFLTVFTQNVTLKFVKVLLQKPNNSLLEKSHAQFCPETC